MTTQADATTSVEWLYMGQRLVGGKLRHAWLDERGENLVFGKVAAWMPGATYAVEVSRDADDRTTVHGSPRYLAEQAERKATDRQREEWRAEHEVAKQIVAAEQAEKAALRDGDELDRALDVLRRYHARLRSMRKQSAFRQWVDAEVSRLPKDERR